MYNNNVKSIKHTQTKLDKQIILKHRTSKKNVFKKRKIKFSKNIMHYIETLRSRKCLGIVELNRSISLLQYSEESIFGGPIILLMM